MYRFLTRLFLIALLTSAGVGAAPLGTAFTYQGELRLSGAPASGPFDFRLRMYDDPNAGSTVGSQITLEDVPVDAGLFALELDFGTALIADRQHWLAIEVRAGASTGSFTALTPRQKVTAAPGALYSLAAAVSDQALSLAAQNVLQVSPSGAPYATLGDALLDVTSPGPDNRWLIDLGPGVYVEAGSLDIPGYVHVRGAGANATVVRSSATNSSPGPAASTLNLFDRAQVSALTVENSGTGTFGIGIHVVNGVTRETRIENVRILANGAGGVGHYGIYLNDAEPVISSAWIRASGAPGFGTSVNAAIGSVNVSGGFPQPLIIDSVLLGAEDSDLPGNCADNSGTGFAWQSVNSSPEIQGSYLCGGHRGLFAGTNGQVRLRDSVVATSSTGSAFLFDITSSATAVVVGSQVHYVGNKFTGTGGLICRDNVNSAFGDVSDGSTPGTACN